MNLGANIRRRRDKLRLTRRAVAEQLAVDPMTIYRWETGERTPTIPALRRLAEVLRVKPGRLLD